MNICGNKVILRALEPSDMPYLREMINDPEMERMVIGWSFPVSEKQQMDWYNRVISDNKNFRFAIMYEGKFVGISTLTRIDWKNRSADHGIKLCNDAPKGVGIGTDSVYATMKYAFEELQLNRLYGSIVAGKWKEITGRACLKIMLIMMNGQWRFYEMNILSGRRIGENDSLWNI